MRRRVGKEAPLASIGCLIALKQLSNIIQMPDIRIHDLSVRSYGLRFQHPEIGTVIVLTPIENILPWRAANARGRRFGKTKFSRLFLSWRLVLLLARMIGQKISRLIHLTDLIPCPADTCIQCPILQMECLRNILCVIHIVFGVIEPREDLHHQRTHDRLVRHKREPSLCRDLVPPLQPFPSGHLVASLLSRYCRHKIIFHYSIFPHENVDIPA